MRRKRPHEASWCDTRAVFNIRTPIHLRLHCVEIDPSTMYFSIETNRLECHGKKIKTIALAGTGVTSWDDPTRYILLME
jgi:hypothetical protein